jgi:hypothetical protein
MERIFSLFSTDNNAVPRPGTDVLHAEDEEAINGEEVTNQLLSEEAIEEARNYEGHSPHNNMSFEEEIRLASATTVANAKVSMQSSCLFS